MPIGHYPRPSLEDRYWPRVAKAGAEDCWLWQGDVCKDGYGRIWHENRNKRATHVALLLDGRPRPHSALCTHSCDNPSCVNPSHLAWGTPASNMAEKMQRRRHRWAPGTMQPCAKLTEDDVRVIRSSPATCTALAEKYGMTVSRIARIRKGLAWRHVV